MAIITSFILGLGGFALAGFCFWKVCEVMAKMQESTKKEQGCRMAEREAAFRREKFLITLLLKNDPQLANTLAKMPEAEQGGPDLEFTELPGFGEARLSRRGM